MSSRKIPIEEQLAVMRTLLANRTVLPLTILQQEALEAATSTIFFIQDNPGLIHYAKTIFTDDTAQKMQAAMDETFPGAQLAHLRKIHPGQS